MIKNQIEQPSIFPSVFPYCLSGCDSQHERISKRRSFFHNNIINKTIAITSSLFHVGLMELQLKWGARESLAASSSASARNSISRRTDEADQGRIPYTMSRMRRSLRRSLRSRRTSRVPVAAATSAVKLQSTTHSCTNIHSQLGLGFGIVFHAVSLHQTILNCELIEPQRKCFPILKPDLLVSM